MTRINSALAPKWLTDQHLLAELRELPRIFTAVNKRIDKGQGFGDIPKEFTLGAGHVKFFYDKLYFLNYRFQDLMTEYTNRYNKKWKYNTLAIDDCIKTSEYFLFRDHKCSSQEKQILIDRISTRITESKQIPRYYGKTITKKEAIGLLNN